MKQLAGGLYQLGGFPPNAINVYLMGGVIVDAGSRHAGRRILRQVKDHLVTANALTHVHPDHQGASKEICDALDIPLWCGEGDAEVMERGGIRERQPDHWANTLSFRFFAGPPHPVARRLKEGDEVGGFRVIETPGHSAGHVAYWREDDRALLLGDVLFGTHPLLGIPQLREPPAQFTPDPARNRDSARKLAELEPELVCFGHGPPLRDTRKLVDFVAGLPR